MKTVVFGAGGFIGTYLLEELSKKKVIAVDIDRNAIDRLRRKKMSAMAMDISKCNLFQYVPVEGVGCVINVASLQPDYVSKDDFDPTDYIKTNTIGVINILKFCIDNKIPKFIHVVSHRSVIGNGGTQDEFSPYFINYDSGFAEFAVSEMAAIEMINCFNAKNPIQTIILRIPSVFGYGSHLEGYRDGEYQKTGFQKMIDDAEVGQPIEVWGDPDVARDIVYVKDVVSAIIKAMESKYACGLYNISLGDTLSLKEEAEAIRKEFSYHSDWRIDYFPERKNNIEECHYDIMKARRDFGWKPKYAFKDMLKDYKAERESGKHQHLVEGRRKKSGIG